MEKHQRDMKQQKHSSVGGEANWHLKERALWLKDSLL